VVERSLWKHEIFYLKGRACNDDDRGRSRRLGAEDWG
jgi:hypothetical protein